MENRWKRLARRAACALLAGTLAAASCGAARAASGYDRPSQKLAALTFDDGPGIYSDSILDTLARHGAKATFFMNGTRLEKYPEQAKRMAAEGHQVANHTYDHPFLTQVSDAKIKQEVDAVAQQLAQLGLSGGENGFLLRPPYGDVNSRVSAAVGVPMIWCSVDSLDWKYQSAARLVTSVSGALEDGGIVLMHESHKSTAQGLDALLTKLEAQGFELVTVDDLLWRRGITPKAGKIYSSARSTGVNRCERALWFDESRLDTHWAYGAISDALARGLMARNEYGEFLPNLPCTRGDFVTALGRLYGASGQAPAAAPFTDVPAGHPAAPYAAWARDAGVMTGVSVSSFAPEKSITRQELAVALARYARLVGAAANAGAQAPAYTDAAQIAAWARDGVALCSALGILRGDDGRFSPKQEVTRAMTATVLSRLGTLPAAKG